MRRFFLFAATCLFGTTFATAQTPTPTNTVTIGSNANWSAYTWTGGVPPVGGSATTVLQFNMSGTTSFTATNNLGNSGEFRLNGLLLNNSSTANTLTLAAGGTPTSFLNFVANGSVNPVLNLNGAGNVSLSSAVTITNDLTFGGTGAGLVNISGVVTGSAALAVNGTGTLVLSGNNAATFSGPVLVTAGTLDLRAAGALGTGALTINGGKLDNSSGAVVTLNTNNVQTWAGNFTYTGTNSLNLGTGAVTVTGNRTVTVTANNLTIGGSIGESGGSFGLTKAGAGNLILGAANSYTGATAINGGLLQFNNATLNGVAAGARDISVGLGAAVAFNFALANAGDLSALVAARIATGSTGSLALTTAANQANQNLDFTAATGVNVPSLSLGAAAGFTVTYSGTLTPAADNVYRLGGGGGTLIFGQALVDAGAGPSVRRSFQLAGAGTVVLTNAANTYTGSTTVTTGTLQFGNGGSATGFTFPNAITNNGGVAFNFDNSAIATFAGAISGTGTLTKAGTGVLTLTTPLNTFTGQTSVTAGTLTIGANNALAPLSTMAISSGAALNLNGFAATVGQLNGSAANSGGTLNLGSGGSLTIGTNGTASVNTSAVTIIGSGSFSRIGNGQYIPGGVSTFTGTATFEGGNETAIAGVATTNGRFTGLTSLTVRGGALVRYTSTAANNSVPRIGGAVITGTTTGTNPDIVLGDALVPGGTFNPGSPSSGSYTESLNTLVVSAGANAVGSAVGGGTVVLSFGTGNVNALARNVGGTLNIAAANTVTAVQFNGTSAPSLVNGILAGYFTFLGADWATLTGAGNNLVSALPGGSYVTTSDPNGWANTDNVSINAAPSGSLATSLAINSLRFGSAQTLNLGGNTLTIGTGGILNNNVASFITNGTVTSGNGADLIVTGPTGGTAANALTISAKITGAGIGLTKSGNNNLILGSGVADTTPNDYTGPTYINGGQVTLDKASSNGGVIVPAVSNVVVVSGTAYSGTSVPGTLAFNRAGQLSTDTSLTISYGGVVNFANNASPTLKSLTYINGGTSGGGITGLTSLTLNGTDTTVLTIGGNALAGLTSVTLSGNTGGGIRYDATRATGSTPTTIPVLNLGGVGRTFTIDDGPATDDLIITTLSTGATAVTVTKSGTGQLNIGSAGNFQSGSTLQINVGTLRIGTTNTFTSTLPNAGPTIAFGGGTFAPQTVAGAGVSQSNLNQLSLTAGASTLALGTGTHTIVFTTPSYTGGTLLITGSLVDGSGAIPVSGGHILFSGYGSSASAAIAANSQFLANVQFGGFNLGQATFVQNGSNVELVAAAVPEPVTIFGLAALGLGFGNWARRRRQRPTA